MATILGHATGALAAAFLGSLNPDPRRLVAALRRGDWRSPFVGRRRSRLLRSLEATMTIVEGYSEHVMDAVVADLDEPFAQLRERMERGRDQRGRLEGLLSRLLGLDVKLRQYRLGKSFCDEVAQRRGIEALNRVWAEPADPAAPLRARAARPLAGPRRVGPSEPGFPALRPSGVGVTRIPAWGLRTHVRVSC